MKVLVVVDMQKDFVDGALGSKEALSIVPNVSKKIKEYQKEDALIIFTRDTHFDNYLETQEGKKLPVAHCIKDTLGWEIVPELDTTNSLIIDKLSFGSTDLPKLIKDELDKKATSLESIELVGLCTDICVISNALYLKANFIETPIYVDEACCAGVSKESHQNALEAMKMCQINIM